MYAAWNGISWTCEAVGNASLAGLYLTSIAMDTSDNPIISYLDSANNLYCAYKAGDTWVSSLVDSGATNFISLAIGTDNVVHIAYQWGGGTLKHAWGYPGVGWSKEFIPGGSGNYCSIAMDLVNFPHIAEQNAKYFYWDGALWNSQPGPVGGSYTSLDLDSSGNAYINYSGGGLIKWSGVWEMPPVIFDPGGGGEGSIKIDTNNNPHISYISSGLTLKYASWEGSSWDVQTVYPFARMSALALDSNNKPHISFWNSGFAKLFYAQWDDIAPIVTLETPSDAGIILTGGDQYIISWEVTDDIGLPSNNYISIFLSTNEGATWTLLSSLEENDPGMATGTFEWTVPNIISHNCLISIEARDKATNEGFGISENEFTISLAGELPTIEAVKINGIVFLNDDVISPKVNLRLHALDGNGIIAARVYLDDIPTPFELNIEPPPSTSFNGWWSQSFLITPEAQTTHHLAFYLEDSVGVTCLVTMEARIMVGDVSVVGTPLNYPNPFKPLSGGGTMINYTLSKDAPVIIMIYDITGSEVKRMKFSAGRNGGRAGVNSVNWDGRNLGSSVVGNGMYLYKIVYRDRVLGSGKIVVLDD